MLGRSTDSLLELRYEFWENWASAFNDTSFDLGVYFDADQSPFTGRTTLDTLPSSPALNGIGADYRMIVGVHGNLAFSQFDQAHNSWTLLYDPNGFDYLNIEDSSDFFEVGIKWSDMNRPSGVRIVSINALLVDQTGAAITDWAPDQGSGYVEIARTNRYIGPPYVAPAASSTDIARKAAPLSLPNPFK